MSDDDLLVVNGQAYEPRKITLPRNHGALIKFDFSDAPRPIALPARGAQRRLQPPRNGLSLIVGGLAG